jgi:Flp pilus assembly protein CpaB
MVDTERRRATRALIWRLRWALVAVFAAALVRVALPGVVQAFGDGDPVIVTTRQVAAGAVLEEEDLKVIQAPPALMPDGAIRQVAGAVGQRAVVSLPRGSLLHGGLLNGGQSHDNVPDGRVASVVRLSDPALADVAVPGDHVDIMASAGATASGSIAPAEVLARSALVLTAPADGSQDDSVAGALGGAAQSGVLLVAVTPAEAELIGGAASWAVITAVLVT